MTIPYSTQTPHGELTIALAQQEDVGTLVNIVESVSAWQVARGIDPRLPSQPLHEVAAKRISHGTTFLARLDSTPAGVVTLGWADHNEAWSDLPGDAVYVYGLMVHRAFAGHAIGEMILHWVGQTALKAGKASVRLECDADNPSLRAYYERAGFIFRGEIEDRLGLAARFEKPAILSKSS